MTVIEHEPTWTDSVALRTPGAARASSASRTSTRAASVAAAVGRVWSRPAFREFALLASVYEVYSLTRRFAAGGADVALGNGHEVLRVEHAIGVAPEHWLNHVVSIRPLLAIPADYAYATLHYVVTLTVLIWLWRAHPSAYVPARRTLTGATVLGLVGFATVPLAPPRMLPGFIDTMARYGHDGWWASAGSAPKGLGSFTNQFAAMPSLHVAWAIWCAWMVATHARRTWVRGLAIAYPVIVVFVVLSTANHYLLDAVAGLLALVCGLALVRACVRLGWLKPPPATIGAR
jgi:hypothetical protein